MSDSSLKKAMDFLENETQFHLGFLPTEQSSPLTRTLDQDFARSSVNGVKSLQRVDRNVLAMARRVFPSKEYARLVEGGERTLRSGGRIVFSGCGATGRLSILLESMWRGCCAENEGLKPYADQVFSIMTGGDYALVRSVESFEDYAQFGRRQVREMGMGKGDLLVAITEGGETSSVLGTVLEALDRGSEAFLMFNNPADLLAEHLERSRKVIQDPRVCVLDLSCGPMALAGSTRMQATTSEQLLAGCALEAMADRLLGRKTADPAAAFADLLDSLESDDSRTALAAMIDFEAGIYRKKGLVTYFADACMLDIFTDTTERSPTFMLPPFRKKDDTVSPPSWVFVKNPLCTTDEFWDRELRRPLRCLNWTKKDYAELGAPVRIQENPPRIGKEDLLKFEVGKESPEARSITGRDAAILITVGSSSEVGTLTEAFGKIRSVFPISRHLSIGGRGSADFHISCTYPETPLHLLEHLAVKLVLNTISTGVMAVLGRITGNWMSWVDISNKKLVDRATRLIAEIGGIDYRSACIRLFQAEEELEASFRPGEERPSVVQYVLGQLKKKEETR